jgi:hypothetical protein
LKELDIASARAEDDITKQVIDYLDSLDETYMPNTSGDTTRFADSVHIRMVTEYQQNIMSYIATIASEYSDRYSKNLARIIKLQNSSPSIRLSQDVLERIDACREATERIGMVDFIMGSIDGKAAAGDDLAE